MSACEVRFATKNVPFAPMSAGRVIAATAMPTRMTASTPTTQPIIEPTAQHADHPTAPPHCLQVAYALKVRGDGHVPCDIAGTVEMPYALHPDGRREAVPNFNKLMELILLRPALMQLTGFVNGLRRADIDARENVAPGEAAQADEPQQHASLASLASLNGAMPEAVDPPLPPNMSPDAPATVLIA